MPNNSIFVYSILPEPGTIGLGTGLIDDGNAFVEGINVTGNIVIPSQIDGYTVVSLLYHSIRNCGHITGLTFPDTLIRIEDVSLTVLPSIKEINIPSSVIYLGDRIDTFRNLKSFTFRDGSRLETIGTFFLQNSYSITHLILPSSIKSIGDDFCLSCHSLIFVSYCGKSDFSLVKMSETPKYKYAIVTEEYPTLKFADKEIKITTYLNCYFPISAIKTIPFAFYFNTKKLYVLLMFFVFF